MRKIIFGGLLLPLIFALNNSMSGRTAMNFNEVRSIGSTIETENLKIEVEKYELKDKIINRNKEYSPKEKYVYVAIIYKVKNISDKPVNSFDLPRITLMEDDKLEYDKNISATINYGHEQGIDDEYGSLNPEDERKIVVVFEIPSSFSKTKKLIVILKVQKESFYVRLQ